MYIGSKQNLFKLRIENEEKINNLFYSMLIQIGYFKIKDVVCLLLIQSFKNVQF